MFFRMRKKATKDESMAIGLVSSPSITTDMGGDDSHVYESTPGGTDTSASDEKLRFEHLEEEEEDDIVKETSEL